jgi:hypothetical protein
MSTELRDISAVERVILVGRSHVIRKLAAKEGIAIGDAPFDARALDAAWERIVTQPLPSEHHEWIVGSFGGLLIDHFTTSYGFELKELVHERGTSLCLVEPRSGIQLFPYDSIGERIGEQRGFFVSLIGQVEAVLNEQGVRRLSEAKPKEETNSPVASSTRTPWFR